MKRLDVLLKSLKRPILYIDFFPRTRPRTFLNCFALELSVFKTKQLRNVQKLDTKPLLYPSRSWLTDFLVFHNDRFVRFSLGFGTRNSQFNDLQNCRYAIFILEQIRMVQNPSFTAMKCSHYGAM